MVLSSVNTCSEQQFQSELLLLGQVEHERTVSKRGPSRDMELPEFLARYRIVWRQLFSGGLRSDRFGLCFQIGGFPFSRHFRQ